MAVATTFRIPEELLKAVQHICIERGTTQQAAVVEGLRWWVDGWSCQAAGNLQNGENPTAYPELQNVVRQAIDRGVTMSELITLVRWVSATRS